MVLYVLDPIAIVIIKSKNYMYRYFPTHFFQQALVSKDLVVQEGKDGSFPISTAGGSTVKH